jgi:predicted nucleotidyltransferase
MTKDEILVKLKELKPKYAKEGFVIKGLFGSYARGDARENSDIDVAIELDEDYLEKRDVWEYFKMMQTLKEEIGVDLGKPSDVFDLSTNAPVAQAIKKDLIYV